MKNAAAHAQYLIPILAALCAAAATGGLAAATNHNAKNRTAVPAP